MGCVCHSRRCLFWVLLVLPQVVDPETYRPFTVHKYPAPILSLAASPASDVVAAGMADGTLSVHRRKMQGTATAEPTRLRWEGCDTAIVNTDCG